MAESDVRQLMGHHSCELRLIVRGFDNAAVHKHISAGQRKGIDGFIVHAMKLEWILHATCGQLLRQTRAEFCQVGIHLRCVAKRQLLFSIGGGSLAESYVVLRREPVPARFELCPLRKCDRNQEKAQGKEKPSHPSAMRSERPEPSTAAPFDSLRFLLADAQDDLRKKPAR